jgi:ribosomal subunit interface protein
MPDAKVCGGRNLMMATLPVIQVVFHGLDRSEAVEEQVREKVLRLSRFHKRIIKCRVVIDCPHQHHRTGRLYNVRVDLSVPGEDVVVRRQPSRKHAHEDLFVALRDAFDSARRRLEDRVRVDRAYQSEAR